MPSGKPPCMCCFHGAEFNNRTRICNEMATSRPIETAFELVLKAIAKHAPEVPVLIIGTKKDEYLRLETDFTKAEIRALEEGRAPERHREVSLTCQRNKEISWQERLQTDCVNAWQRLVIKLTFVSRGEDPSTFSSSIWCRGLDVTDKNPDDQESIKTLMHHTMNMLLSNSPRSGMVAAQVVDPDLKIDLAVDETIRLLRTAVKTASIGAPLMLSSSVSTPSFSRLLCGTILRCFGLSRVSDGQNCEEDVNYIMDNIVWSNLAAFMAQSISTAIGNAPFIVTMPLFEAPAAARMIIRCACDLIIILDRACQIGGKHVTRHQVQEASAEYLKLIEKIATRDDVDMIDAHDRPSMRRLVHQQINQMFPIASTLFLKIYKKEQIEKIRQRIKEIVADHRMRQSGDQAPSPKHSFDISSRESQETLLGSIEDEEDLKALYNLK